MLHQVGVGALGPVFRTYEPTRDRLVAVKVFRLDITPEQAQALADELATAAEAGLFHPSIVEPVAAGVEGTVAYRADEYVAAETLDVAMRHYAPAPIEKVLPFITQLGGAIDFARTAGVGHGALHPRDIFVTPEEARASGFGVVEALERVGLRAPVRRPYTAPERVAGAAWGAPADVFSLAVVAYELLTGRRPSGMGAQIGTVTGGRHAGAVHAVLVQAMDENPARRHQSALAFASALDAASRGEARLVPAVAAVPLAPVAREDAAEDDIAAERDEDDAHMALTLDERSADEQLDTPADRSLFDDEAVEDLALDPAARDQETERFADEFAVAAGYAAPGIHHRHDAPAEAARDDREHDEGDELTDEDEFDRVDARGKPDEVDEDEIDAHVEDERPAHFAAAGPVTSYDREPVVLHDHRAPGVGVMMTVAALALLVGFAGGYAVRGSVTPAAVEGDVSTGAGTAPATPEPAAAAPYSEQAVTPPATPSTTGTTSPAAEPPQPVSEVPTGGTGEPGSPAAVPAPAPAATTGRVDVRSTPPGASVTVDGVWRGRTPLNLSDLRFGRYTIRVVQPGYSTAREEVTLSASAPSRDLSFRLRREAAPPAPPARPAPARPPAARPAARPAVYTGSIYVDSRPRGARVMIDNKFMGTTPVRIPEISIGSHVVRLQLAEHRDWTTSTRVTAGQESRVTGSLERNY